MHHRRLERYRLKRRGGVAPGYRVLIYLDQATRYSSELVHRLCNLAPMPPVASRVDHGFMFFFLFLPLHLHLHLH